MTLLADPIARPQGKAERWSDDEIALLILLLLSDAPRAAALWASLVPIRYRLLLQAVPFDNAEAVKAAITAGTVPPVWFDVDAQRYGLASRGYIAPQAIVAALEAFRSASMRKEAAAVGQVYSGAADVPTWQAETADNLKILALAAALFGVGGVQRLTQANVTLVSRGLRFQLERLALFARDIERGAVVAAKAAKRAAMYPDSVITGVYHQIRRKAHIAVGYKFEQNILDPSADHCGHDPRRPDVANCPDLTAKGWQTIGSMPRIGQRACLWNCRCHWEFARDTSASSGQP